MRVKEELVSPRAPPSQVGGRWQLRMLPPSIHFFKCHERFQQELKSALTFFKIPGTDMANSRLNIFQDTFFNYYFHKLVFLLLAFHTPTQLDLSVKPHPVTLARQHISNRR